MDISPLARAVIKRGTILHSDEFDYVDHGKMFVVMGEDDTQLYGFFFINSDINPKIWKGEKALSMQMQLKKSNYPDILKYDSFLGCQSLLHISKSELINQFSDGRAQYIGDLVEDDINMALEAVRRSDLYSDYEKDTFFK